MANLSTALGWLFIVCAGIFLCLHGAAAIWRARDENYYRGLKDQMHDASDSLHWCYEKHEVLTRDAVVKLLRYLLDRRSPSIQQLKVDDEEALKLLPHVHTNDEIEATYWLFDHLQKRREMPMSERDAFKSAVRSMLSGAAKQAPKKGEFSSPGEQR